MSGLCLSLAYTFRVAPTKLSSLTLVIGVAVAKALDRLGSRGHRLKWPNDIMVIDAKLGGVLTDALTGAGSSITIVTGVGMNIDLSLVPADDSVSEVDYPIIDLRRCVDEMPSRSAVAALIIEEMQRAIQGFEEDGLEPYRKAWNHYDWLKGQEIRVEMPDCVVAGTADGIDASGALRVLTDNGRRRVFTGSVSLASDAAKQQ
jgi:BirA family biotin operon repressor/biotin-[acetyl-CoA-carboxylase] ligase